ncbi:MAG: hypothetical protein NTU83_07055, partial [Candidatus Hydrogenedentes bacterium]|nr:hypothetical protein [Candidatus Hydrogenedentota bacterium]
MSSGPFKRRFGHVLILICLTLMCGMLGARADDSCTTCGDAPNFPDATAFLEAHGFAAKDYSVLLTWSEQARDGSGAYVSGYRVRPVQGGVPLDLYSDSAGNLLDAAQLAALGIAEKRWDLPPVEAPARLPEAIAKAVPERPAAIGPWNALSPQGGVALPPIDVQKMAQEDNERAVSGVKGGRRTGVFQNLDPPIRVDGDAVTFGTWQAVAAGGSLWSASIASPDALGIRVHFALIALPVGAQVIVYNAGNPLETLGPYTEAAEHVSDLWSATCFSDSVIVECYVPEGIDRTGVHLLIDKITHQYVSLGDVAWSKAVVAQNGAGSCENDVTYYPAWASTATGIAGYQGVDHSGTFFCSGTLLADISNTGTPYFLS